MATARPLRPQNKSVISAYLEDTMGSCRLFDKLSKVVSH
jgi:hypothetical protein